MPDVLRALQCLAVLVILDKHRQLTEPELLVSCPSGASLRIDVHVGADHLNEPASGIALAHSAVLPSQLYRRTRYSLPEHGLHTVERYEPFLPMYTLSMIAEPSSRLRLASPGVGAQLVDHESIARDKRTNCLH